MKMYQILPHLLTLLLIHGLIQSIHMSTNIKRQYEVQQAKLLRIGFNNVLWDYINSLQFKSLNVSSTCIASLDNVHKSMDEGQQWPLSMLDSSSRFARDATATGYYDFGNYDRCLNLNWINNGQIEYGQHCTISLLPTLSESEYNTNIFTRNKVIAEKYEAVFKIGLCIPSSCSESDLETIFSGAIKPYGWHYRKTDQCRVKESLNEKINKALGYQKVALGFIICLILANLYSTLYQWSNEAEVETVKSSWTRHFSLIKNYNNFINPGSVARVTYLTKLQIVVHTITLIFHTTTWFITCKGWGLFANSVVIIENRNENWMKTVFTDYWTDTLFVYGGMARSLEFWKLVGPTTSFTSSFRNMALKMLMISLAYTPLIAFTFITPLFFDGPVSSIFGGFTAETCTKSIFHNFAFWQNNYRPIVNMCLPHTWSVAVEFQLLPFIIILIHLYKKAPKATAIFNSIIVIGATLYTGIQSYLDNSQPHLPIRALATDTVEYWFEKVYLPTSMHIWLYLACPLWTYFIMYKHDKTNSILAFFTKKGKPFVLLMAVLQFFPHIWVHFDNLEHATFLNFAYFTIYRILALMFFTYVVMTSPDQLRRFFTHPLDKDTIKEDNNNTEQSSNGKIYQNNNNEKDLVKVENESSYSILHIISNLWRASYYAHISVILALYSTQRWPLNSTESYIVVVIESILLSLLGGFIFHLFVAAPVNSIISTLKSKPKIKVK